MCSMDTHVLYEYMDSGTNIGNGIHFTVWIMQVTFNANRSSLRPLHPYEHLEDEVEVPCDVTIT